MLVLWGHFSEGTHCLCVLFLQTSSPRSICFDPTMQVDYLRAVGPGVYVGVGWKQGREGTTELGRRFLAFLLVKEV